MGVSLLNTSNSGNAHPKNQLHSFIVLRISVHSSSKKNGLVKQFVSSTAYLIYCIHISTWATCNSSFLLAWCAKGVHDVSCSQTVPFFHQWVKNFSPTGWLWGRSFSDKMLGPCQFWSSRFQVFRIPRRALPPLGEAMVSLGNILLSQLQEVLHPETNVKKFPGDSICDHTWSPSWRSRFTIKKGSLFHPKKVTAWIITWLRPLTWTPMNPNESKISLQTDSLIRSCVVDKKDLKLPEIHPKFTLKMMIGRGPNILKNSDKLRVWLKSKLKKYPKKNTDFFASSPNPPSIFCCRTSIRWSMDLASGGTGTAPKLGAAAGGAVADGNAGAGGGAGEAPSAVRSESIFLGKSVFKQKKESPCYFWSLGGSFPEVFCCWFCWFVEVCWLLKISVTVQPMEVLPTEHYYSLFGDVYRHFQEECAEYWSSDLFFSTPWKINMEPTYHPF